MTFFSSSNEHSIIWLEFPNLFHPNTTTRISINQYLSQIGRSPLKQTWRGFHEPFEAENSRNLTSKWLMLAATQISKKESEVAKKEPT